MMKFNLSQLFSFIFFLLISLYSSNAQHASPFEFVKKFQGSHKGEKFEGLHQLKQYLTKFGYLNHQTLDSQVQSVESGNHFDNILESAIKTYQVNYHLKATGTLDAATISKMMMPRCGVSDIINGNSRMRATAQRKKHHHHHHHVPNAHKSIHAVSHYTFYQGLPKWPADKTNLTYKFEPNTPENATRVIARAFDQWASATHFTFINIQRNSSIVADISIGFHSRDHGDGYPFDGPYGVLAHASPPTSGSFHLDADEPWSFGPSVPGSIDLESVALHEIGHLLGLEHSTVKEAIMYPSISDGMIKGLHGDDIQGITTLYTY